MFNKFFKNNQQSFLDMKNAEIISHSIVFIESIYKGQIMIGTQPIASNSFNNIMNNALLKKITQDVLKKDVTLISQQLLNPMQQIVNFDNLVLFQRDLLPIKFTIQHNINSKDMTVVKNLAKEILNCDDDLKNQIFAIGVNFAMFVSNDDCDIKNKLFTENAKTDLDNVSASLKYNTNNTQMTLQVSNAIYNNVSGIFFNINFHNEIVDKNNIPEVLNENFFNIAEGKMDTLFSK